MSEGMEASFCSCDYEPFEFYHVTEPIARKQWKCCECGGEIQPGERYERAATKFEGIFECYKTCLTCATIRLTYCAPYRALHETLWEHLGTDYLTGKVAWDDDD